MERAFKRRDISIRNEITEFRRNFKDCVLRFAGIVSTIKLTCATFGVETGVEIQFKRRNITIRHEITEFSTKFESFSFAICRD
jgi:hypothetical protein